MKILHMLHVIFAQEKKKIARVMGYSITSFRRNLVKEIYRWKNSQMVHQIWSISTIHRQSEIKASTNMTFFRLSGPFHKYIKAGLSACNVSNDLSLIGLFLRNRPILGQCTLPLHDYQAEQCCVGHRFGLIIFIDQPLATRVQRNSPLHIKQCKRVIS